VALTPVPVRVSRAEVTALTGDTVSVSLTCSAGFYVRCFAQTLGERLGMGACLAALRRTRSGDFLLTEAVAWDRFTAVPSPASADLPLRPLHQLLTSMPAVVLSPRGQEWVSHGRAVPPADYRPLEDSFGSPAHDSWVRLLDPGGTLIAVGQATDEPPGTLRPTIVLI
jgi:tRNA pseudouridine55 synthase